MFSVLRSDWSLTLNSLSSLSCADDLGMFAFPVCDPLFVFNILWGPPKILLSSPTIPLLLVCDFYPFLGKRFTRRAALYKHYTQSQASKYDPAINYPRC